MNSIAIDLATATCVLTTTVNLIILASLMLILGQLQRLSWGTQSEEVQVPPRIFGNLRKVRGSKEENKPFPVHSASDEKMLQREQLRNQAQRLEAEALVSKVVSDY